MILMAFALVTSRGEAQDKPQKLDAGNWTEAVGFAPDKALDGWKVGSVVNVSNWGFVKAWLPDGITTLVRDWKLRLRTAAYRPIHPSAGYMAATLEHWGTAKAVDTGKSYRKKGIDGYGAGLPFPNPRNALEVAWNLHFSYQGDDGGIHFAVHWISDGRGVWKTEDWRWIYIARAMHRTDLGPRPDIDWFADRGIQYASVAWTSAPGAKHGLRALFYRFEHPRDQRGYLYIPSTRRSLKLAMGTPGVPWNVTNMLNEDVRGFGGYPEWMRWKLLGKRTILAPMHAGVRLDDKGAEAAFDFDNAPHWNPDIVWEPRPVWVLEGRHKFWTSPYERVVMYVDAETYYVPIKEAYDGDDKLWKVFVNAYNESTDEGKVPPSLALSLAVDVKAGHATAFPTYQVFHNAGLERARFTESALRRAGH